ncbi:MAG: PTS sugar transporter subunit IIA [Acidobacteria bacterium]|nr:MAG: PTS sugar transporter subunit IIA [Acidobacteriota bacterium]
MHRGPAPVGCGRRADRRLPPPGRIRLRGDPPGRGAGEENLVIGLLAVTHGGLADELVAAARRIVRDPAPMMSVSLAWDDDVKEASRRIERAIGELDEGQGVIVVTDMLGGTPANVAMAFLEPGRVEVVTGVNLPMLIKFNNLPPGVGLAEAARLIAEKGRSHITVAGEILAAEEDGR